MASQVSNAHVPHQTQSTSTSGIPHDRIAKRAYEKWCNRGRPQGTDKQDWMEAEAELRSESTRMGLTGSQSSQPRMPNTGTVRR